MSYRWPNKDPNETLDYTIDWTRLIPSDVTVTAVAWYIDDENGVKTLVVPSNTVNTLTVVATSYLTNKTTIMFSEGTHNREYKISCAISLSNSNVLERSVRLSVKEF